MRQSRDEVDQDGVVRNGFDYGLQVWVEDYKCLPVGLGALLAGRDIRTVPGHEVRND